MICASCAQCIANHERLAELTTRLESLTEDYEHALKSISAITREAFT